MRRLAALAALVAAAPALAGAIPDGAIPDGAIPDSERRSGFAFMSPPVQAMQRDDLGNPGMLGVLEGEALWNAPAGAAGPACAACHGDARESMRGVAARHPAFDPASGRPLPLDQRIERCRTQHQRAEPLPPEDPRRLALTAYVAHQSRGLPIATGADPRLAPFVAEGRALFQRRMGQLNLSCANCHDDRWGRRLGSAVIPQGHPTGYPIYRLEWQSLGSLQRRLRTCLAGVRAEPFAADSPQAALLELYLMVRARGMPLETPAVRP